MGFILAGLGAGFGIGAWRNVGPVPEPVRAALVIFVLAVAAAGYLAGRARSRRGTSATAVAVAVAKARASASSSAVGNQVLVINAADGAGARYAGLDRLPWDLSQGVSSRDELDGAEAGELCQDGDDQGDELADVEELIRGAAGAARASEAARSHRRPMPPLRQSG